MGTEHSVAFADVVSQSLHEGGEPTSPLFSSFSIEDAQELLYPFPVEVSYTPSQGRFILASRDIAAGEVVLQATPFCTAVEDQLKTTVCCVCFEHSVKQQKYTYFCKKCNEVWYCSEECQRKGMPAHYQFECAHFRRMRGVGKPLLFDADGYTEAKMLLQMFAKVILLTKKENALWRDMYMLDISDSANGSKTERELKFSDVFLLVGNRTALNPIAEAFVNDLQLLIMRVMGKDIQAALPDFQPYDIVELICKQRCNRFGIWSKKDKCLGVALCPPASFFNHNCAPNCIHEQQGQDVIIRALHPIPKGNELCISYIKLTQPTKVRQEELLMNYHFACSCVRCKDPTGVYDQWLENFFCTGNNCYSLLSPIVPTEPILTPSTPAITLVCKLCGFSHLVSLHSAPQGVCK